MKRLRIRLTLFNTAVVGIVLVGLTLLSLIISERSMRDNVVQNFLNNQHRLLNVLYQEDQIKLTWLHEFENTDGMIVCIWDQGKPLFSVNGKLDQRILNIKEAREISATSSLEPDEPVYFTAKGKEKYYAGYSRLSKGKGELEVVLLYPIASLNHRITYQRFIVWSGVGVAIWILALFSWYFTGRILRPIEENQRKQAEFIAAASHELRTPLAGILSAVEAMEKGKAEDRKRFSGMIRQEGQRMTRLIGDMLTMASSESGNWVIAPRPTELDMLLLSVYEIFASRVKEKGLKLSISLPEADVPLLETDPERLEQVLGILLENAMAYTPAPGTIALSLFVMDKKIRLTVSDSGPGIPDEEKKRIFDRFYRRERGRSDPSHFGLGLSIASELLHRMDGSLWVEDSSLGGAAFHIEFSGGISKCLRR